MSITKVPGKASRDARDWKKKQAGLWLDRNSRERRPNGTETYVWRSLVYESGRQFSQNFRASVAEAKPRHEARSVNVRSGAVPVSTKTTLDEVAQDFFETFAGLVASGERAPRTLERYQTQYAKHIAPVFGNRAVQKITPGEVTRWVSTLRRKGLYDVSSIWRVLALLLERALERGLIAKNPIRQVPKLERPRQRVKQPPRLLTDDEVTKLIAHTPEKYRTLIALVGFTGLRISEALGLVWSNLDLEAGVLKVELQLERKKRNEPVRRVRLKTENSKREVELLPELVALLKRHRAEAFARGQARPEQFVFTTETGSPLYFRNVAARGVDKGADAAELNTDGIPRLSAHDLRHTAISRWVAAGLDVAQVARQAGDTIQTIVNVYATELDAAKRRPELRQKLAAGTAISLGAPSRAS